ncbi:MAG: glycine--tRNA ligase [Lachnospiraceae bacterium]|nr:glycine--tRNA ligase [Lachnospiraceae bacterium]
MKKSMDKIVALAKSRGFVYPGSEIYGGLANTWDYGNLGVELKNNVKHAWWQKFVQENPYNVGVDCAILMNPQTWVASGHLGGFSDPLMDCKACHERFRADQLIENFAAEKGIKLESTVDGWSHEEMEKFINDNNVPCPTCGKHDFTGIREFNLMFKTFQGVTEEAKDTVYLRPETAQGIFVNFKNVQRTSRKKVPFGICQVGKSFRNEITPGNFTFRTREFEQMELEFFCKPGTQTEWFEYWRKYCYDWLLSLGIAADNLRMRDHDPEELSFYSDHTTDIEYAFPFTEWGELWGIASRTDYDLTQHQNTSGESMEYFDDETNEKYIPYVVEPSLGADRVTLAFLCEAYDEENIGTEENPDIRTVLHFHPAIAPVKIGVLPLSKKLAEGADKIYAQLSKKYNCEYDDRGNIGKRYRRQDEIGTPFCVTYDFDSENDGAVTVRDRDSMQQERIKIDELDAYFADKFEF